MRRLTGALGLIPVQHYSGSRQAPSAAADSAVDRRRAGLRSRLLAGDLAVGTMLFKFNTPGVPRIVGATGADFILIDLEHTGWSVDGIRPLLAAARAESLVPIVRAQGSARHLVSAVLDAGSRGVMVPMVSDAAEAARIITAARFAPQGSRGFGLVYPDQVTSGVDRATEIAEAETIVILLIETLAGLENVEEVAGTAGVDVLWVGQYDLSMSLGIPGKLNDPRLRAAEDRVVAACADAGITAGVLVGDVDAAQAMIDRGFRMIALGTDINLYAHALREGFDLLRAKNDRER